ncbi:MAG: phospholipase [Gemmatimonadota bacterium]
MIREGQLSVSRTARYALLGARDGVVRDLWFVFHGYGQLAARFLRGFEPLDDGSRLIVAAEGLSRFYLDTAESGRHAQRVGASWMTREGREQEIEDYLGYLNSLHTHVLETLAALPARTVILGFSQGVATAARWATLGNAGAELLIAWGGMLPEEIGPETLRTKMVRFVSGTADTYLDQDAMRVQAAGLAAQGVRVEVSSFQGGHVIDAATLLESASPVRW